jgi:hypothetical protein
VVLGVATTFIHCVNFATARKASVLALATFLGFISFKLLNSLC